MPARSLIPLAYPPLMLLGAALAACGDPTAPPTTAAIEVSTATAGPEPDPDGYTVQMDAEPALPIQAAGTVQFSDITPGAHTVQLAGLSANCAVAEQNPRAVDVPAGETARISFSVTCGATTGGLQVTAATSGDAPDADGYTVTVDGGTGRPVAANGEVTFDGLAPGSHSVQLSGSAANCRVVGDNPRPKDVAAGSTAEVAFTVTCGQPDVNGYVRTDLDFLPVAINNQGHIAGIRGHTLVLWRNGVATDLGLFDGVYTAVTGLNNHDVVVGFYTPENSRSRGVLWDGMVHDLGLDFIPRGGINDAGEMAGVDTLQRGVFRKGDVSVPMDCLPESLNNRGEVTGVYRYDTPEGGMETQACTWDGVLHDLGNVDEGGATDINETSTVVGSYSNSFTYDALIWKNGSRTQLPSLGGSAAASAINNSGVVVGSSDEMFNSDAYLVLPVVWKDGTILKLADEFGEAQDINDSGQIVGYVTSELNTEFRRGVLWTPVE